MATRTRSKRKQRVLAAFDEQALIFEGIAKAKLEQYGLKNSRLYRSVKGVVIRNKSITQSRILLEYNAYGDFVNIGRKAGGKQPPVSAIIDWMNRYKIVPRNGTKSQVAWLIARAIKRRGIKPRPWLDEASEDYASFFNREVFLDFINNL